MSISIEQRLKTAATLLTDYGTEIEDYLVVCPDLAHFYQDLTVEEALLNPEHWGDFYCEKCGSLNVQLKEKWKGTAFSHEFQLSQAIDSLRDEMDAEEMYEAFGALAYDVIWESEEEVYGVVLTEDCPDGSDSFTVDPESIKELLYETTDNSGKVWMEIKNEYTTINKAVTICEGMREAAKLF